MTLEEWKEGVSKSSHIRKGEKAIFRELKDGSSHRVSAGIEGHPSIFLGNYFINDYEKSLVGTGWWHG